MSYFSRLAHLFAAASRGFLRHRAAHTAAAVAYYSLFSLFPLLALVTLALRFALPEGQLGERVIRQAAELVLLPPDVLDSIVSGLLEGKQGVGWLAPLGFLWAATGVFASLRTALEAIWEESMPRSLIRQKLTDLVMLLASGGLLLLSVIVAATVRVARVWTARFTGEALAPLAGLWDVAGLTAGVLVNFAAFFLLYRLAPGRRRHSREVWFGALTAAIGFELAKAAFLWYLQQFGAFSDYGAVGWVFGLLSWGYISAALILYGAELVAQYPRVMGSDGAPSGDIPTRTHKGAPGD